MNKFLQIFLSVALYQVYVIVTLLSDNCSRWCCELCEVTLFAGIVGILEFVWLINDLP
jgi:hypothetical protein